MKKHSRKFNIEYNPKYRIKIIIAIIILLLAIPIVSFPYSSKSIQASYPEKYGLSHGEDILNNTAFQDITNHWARTNILRMAAQNIMRGYNPATFMPNSPVTREEVMALLIRIMGDEEVAQEQVLEDEQEEQQAQAPEDEDMLEDLDLQFPFSPWVQGYINQALVNEIITEEEAEETEWQEGAQRQEVAYWTAMALELDPVFGESMQRIYAMDDWMEITTNYQPYVEAAMQNNIILGNPDNNFLPNGEITRAEMAVIMDRINDSFLDRRNSQKLRGSITGISETENIAGSNDFISGKTIRISTIKGNVYNLISGDRIRNSWERESLDLVVFKDNNLGDDSLLEVGDQIEMYFNDDLVKFIEVKDFDEIEGEGIITSIDMSQQIINIEDFDGSTYSLNFYQETRPTIGYREVTMGDLISGMEIDFKAIDGTISDIIGYTDLEPGFIQPSSRTARGRLIDVNLEDGQIELEAENGSFEMYDIGFYTNITQGGELIESENLRIGERVILFMDEIQTNEVSRIRVGDNQGKVAGIYKGRIDRANPRNASIVLDNVYQYYLGTWISHTSQMNLELFRDTELYYKGQQVTANDLNDIYRNQIVYAAVMPGLGRERGMKVYIQDGEEYSNSGEIDEISFSADRLSIGNDRIYLDESSIVIRNGNLVDIMYLYEEDDIFYTYNRRGEANIGAVVNLHEFYPSDYRIYKGDLEQITRHDLTIRGYGEYDNHTWSERESDSREETFSFRGDTFVMEVGYEEVIQEGEEGEDDEVIEYTRIISLDDFINSRFSGTYDDYLVHIVAKGDRIIGLSLREEETGSEITSVGRIENIDFEEETINLSYMKDWNAFRKRWSNTYTEMEAYMDEALIIKDDGIIDLTQLSIGDTIYLTRDVNKGILGIVQDNMIGGIR